MSRLGFIRGISLLMVMVFMTCTAGIVIWQVMPLSASAKSKNYLSRAAETGDFEIIISGNGHLEAIDSVTLYSEVERDVKILEIVAEGSYVKQGDILCRLDSGEIQERLAQQQSDVIEAEAKLLEAEKALGIQARTNETKIEESELNSLLASLDLDKYRDGEYQQKLGKLKGELKLEEEEMIRAKESLEFTKRMARKGYRSQTDLEASQLAVSKALLEFEAKAEELRVLEKYEYQRQIAELSSKKKDTKSKMERAKEEAEIEMAKVTAEVAARKANKEYEDIRLNYWKKQFESCEIRSPKDGQVIYANEERSRFGSNYEIRVGSSVYERMPIIRLPDNSSLKIKAKIHEANFARLSVGNLVRVGVEAFPGYDFRGEIMSVSAVPISGDFPNYDQKYYVVEIRLHPHEHTQLELKPGLSVTFQIVSEERANVLQIPVQAVVTVGKESFVYLDKGDHAEKCDLILGKSNDLNVEVLAGLADGDKVLMNPLSTFTKEISDMRQKLEVSSRQKGSAAESLPQSADQTPATLP